MPRASRRFRVVLDPSLSDLAYRCAPDGCPRGRTCCVGLVVEVSKKEIRAIDSLMDELAVIVPSLREADGYASVFIDDDPGAVIESHDDGRCPFLYRTRDHALCSIHSLAVRTSRSVASVKPAACRHWPILLVQDGDAIRVTVQPAAIGIGCVAPRRELPGHPTVLEAYRAEIEEICGGDQPRARSRRRA